MLYLLIFLAVTGVLLTLISVFQARFVAQIMAVERQVGTGAAGPRTGADPTNAILALARRHGAQAQPCGPVRFTQTGVMWPEPGARSMPFKARQTTATTATAFVWRAAFKPFGAVMAADYLTEATAGLRVKFLGLVTLVNAVGRADVRKGQRLRYLAELPWAPDAMLHNPEIDWRAVGPDQWVAGIGFGAERAEVTFMLDAEGLITAASCAARPRLENGASRDRPWGGRFWDYREIEGRMIPTRVEVYWFINGERFVYWSGTIDSWTAKAP